MAAQARAVRRRRSNKKKSSRLRKAIVAPYQCIGLNQPLHDYNMKDLQALCSARTLKKQGKKAILIARLIPVLEKEKTTKNKQEKERVKAWQKVQVRELLSLLEFSEAEILSGEFKDALDAGRVKTKKLLKLMATEHRDIMGELGGTYQDHRLLVDFYGDISSGKIKLPELREQASEQLLEFDEDDNVIDENTHNRNVGNNINVGNNLGNINVNNNMNDNRDNRDQGGGAVIDRAGSADQTELRRQMDSEFMNGILQFPGSKCGYRDSIYADNAPMRQTLAGIPRKVIYRSIPADDKNAGPAMKAVLPRLIDHGLVHLSVSPPPEAVKVDENGAVINQDDDDDDMEEDGDDDHDEEKVDLGQKNKGHAKFVVIRCDPLPFYNQLSDEKKEEYKEWIKESRINLINYILCHWGDNALNRAYDAGLVEGWRPQSANANSNYTEDEMHILALL